jgi:hypothetical protein
MKCILTDSSGSKPFTNFHMFILLLLKLSKIYYLCIYYNLDIKKCHQSMPRHEGDNMSSLCSKKVVTVCTGVLLFVVVMSVILRWSNVNITPIDTEYKFEYTVTTINNNSMNHCRQSYFALSNYTRLHICTVENNTLIDIRLFLNNLPTIKGIHLSLQEWAVFKNIVYMSVISV